MKPKDLLVHLEKGDRTLHHLAHKRSEPQTNAGFLVGSPSSFLGQQAQAQLIQYFTSPTWGGTGLMGRSNF